MAVPHAPWKMAGECVVAMVRRRVAVALPEGIHRLPGPTVLAAVRYSDSPVGPYLELAVGEPARLGARPGLCVTTTVVSSPDARVGGRLNWGFPKELGTLSWSSDGHDRELRWDERGITVRARGVGPPIPVLIPVPGLQRRADGPVTVPGRLRGRGRLARVELETFDGDPLEPLAGRHFGVVVCGMRFVIDPARMPVGRRATFLAPLRAPEPALSMGTRSAGD